MKRSRALAGLSFGLILTVWPSPIVSADPVPPPLTDADTPVGGMGVRPRNNNGTAEVEAQRPGRPGSSGDAYRKRSDSAPSSGAKTQRSGTPSEEVEQMCADARARGVPSAELPAACAALITSLVTTVDPAVAASRAVARLPLTKPEPRIGPDPSVNQWKMAAVGYPLWLWTDGPRNQSTTLTEQGITITIDARLHSTTFAMGDGTTKTCETTTPHGPHVRPGQESPTCGYRYRRASKPNPYTVSATAHWDITWSALDQSGTMRIDHSGSRTLEVGELLALRTR